MKNRRRKMRRRDRVAVIAGIADAQPDDVNILPGPREVRQ